MNSLHPICSASKFAARANVLPRKFLELQSLLQGPCARSSAGLAAKQVHRCEHIAVHYAVELFGGDFAELIEQLFLLHGRQARYG